MCDRPTISKEKGIARHQEHWLATGNIFATPEEKKLLGCHLPLPLFSSGLSVILNYFNLWQKLKLEAPFAVEVNHFSTSPIATMPGALSVLIHDWWGIITPFKSVWTVGQKHPQLSLTITSRQSALFLQSLVSPYSKTSHSYIWGKILWLLYIKYNLVHHIVGENSSVSSLPFLIRNQRTIANSNQSVDQALQLSLKCCY